MKTLTMNEKLAMLATFAHEILIGSMTESQQIEEAQKVLKLVGLENLNDVVELSERVEAPKTLDQQIADAQVEVASWTEERRRMMRLG